MANTTTKKPVTDEKKSAAYFRNAIPAALHDFELETGKSAEEMTQSCFSAALMYIHDQAINENDLLDNSNRYIDNVSLKSYDIDLLQSIANIYIALCNRYVKVISVYGYSLLTGINYDLLLSWSSNARRNATPGAQGLIKRLESASEQSKRDLLTDKGRNPVGILALLNHDYGYNLPGVSREVVPARLSADEIRHKIGLLSENKPLTDTIETD